jgi:ABC-type branched-subunit amino acid transport system ATPase component/branched-subunit amino acid ABC-type transport system permease component
MSELLTFVISGAVAGSLYAILASGLVLSYSASGLFNFAYGGIAFTSAVLYYELNTGLGWPIAYSAIAAILVFGPVLGWGLNRLMFAKLARSGPTAQIVATVGLSIALPAAAIFIVERLISVGHFDIPGVDNVTTPPGIGPNPKVIFHLFGSASIDTNEIATLAAAAFCAIGLWILLRHTRLGLSMRASVDRRDLAALRGIDPDRTSSIAWMLSTTLASLCGVLAAPILSLGSSAFLLVMLVAATAAVFGGLRSIPVAFAGGLALGIIEDLVAGYVGPHVDINGLATAVPYILTFFGLLFLLRDRRRKGGTVAEESPPRDVLHDQPKLKRGIAWAIAGIGLVVYSLVVANDFYLGLIVSGLCLGLVFLSFTVVTGIGGMVSLAQATFVTAAALIAGLLVAHHAPFVVALLGGVASAALLGALVALPALRLGGVALALATLAIALIGDQLLFQIGPLINGQLGWTINRPVVWGINFASNKSMFVLMCAVGLIGIWVVRNLQRSPSGRAMLAVRSSPIAAPASGISPVMAKLGLFTVSAAIAGFGGVMCATYAGTITSSDFPSITGLIWLAVVVTFGVRRPAFAIVAGLVYEILPQLLLHVTSSTVFPQMLFGLGGIGLARNPEGLSDAGRAIGSLWTDHIAPRFHGGSPADTGSPVDAGSMAGMESVASGDPVNLGGLPVVTKAVPNKHIPVTGGSSVASPPSLLQLTGVCAGYGDVEVLHSVNITVAPGTVLGVFGANGAGKSTLCSVISGLLAPTAGTITFRGDDVTARTAVGRSRGGLLLAPESRGIFPDLTVDENLRVLLRDALLRDLAYQRFPILGERRMLPAGVLSGGEQQMLTLAPVLADPPALLVADEPSLGLAPQIVEQVFGMFKELRDKGVTLVLVEEKVRDVLPVADELIILELGRVVWAGRPNDGGDERLASAYLGIAEACEPTEPTASQGDMTSSASTSHQPAEQYQPEKGER